MKCKVCGWPIKVFSLHMDGNDDYVHEHYDEDRNTRRPGDKTFDHKPEPE